MKIKRYTAASMRAALAQVRAEQGPDAVILSSRRGEEGIEVIAAVDYDEGLFVAVTRQRPAEPNIPPEPAAPALAAAETLARAPAVRAAVPTRPTPAPPTPMSAIAPTHPAPRASAQAAAARVAPSTAGKPDAAYGAVQRELRDLRHLLETGLAGMSWSDKRLREPLQARILEELSALDIAPDVALRLAELAPPSTGLDNPSHI